MPPFVPCFPCTFSQRRRRAAFFTALSSDSESQTASVLPAAHYTGLLGESVAQFRMLHKKPAYVGQPGFIKNGFCKEALRGPTCSFPWNSFLAINCGSPLGRDGGGAHLRSAPALNSPFCQQIPAASRARRMPKKRRSIREYV